MHTILGKMLESVSRAMVIADDGKRDDEMRSQLAMLLADRAAHFVLDPKLLELLRDKKVQASMVTLVKHGIRALPFDPMLVEWRDKAFVHFVRLQTKPLVPPVWEDQLRDAGKKYCDIYAYPMTTMAGDYGDRNITAMNIEDPMPISWDGGTHGRDDRPFVCWMGRGRPGEEKLRDHLAGVSVRAMAMAMLLLNNRSVAKRRIDTTAMNRARMKNNKLPIPDYTVLRIGTIYDRHGREVSNPTGRHMPVHWRIAHVRNQPFGPGRKQTRPILIPAVLVNFDSDTVVEEVPLPKHEVVE